jgi:tetratricopeptide (TPR) repeat protein
MLNYSQLLSQTLFFTIFDKSYHILNIITLKRKQVIKGMVLSIRALAMLLLLSIGFVYGQNTLQTQFPQQDLIELQDLLDKKQFGSSFALSSKLLEQSNPPSERGNLAYIKAYSALQIEHPDAEIFYRSFLVEYPEHPKSTNANYDLGNYYYQKKEYSKSISYFKTVKENKLSKKDRIELNFKTGYSYFTQKNFSEALPFFDKVKSNDNNYTFASYYYAGYCELKTKQFPAALSDLQKAESNSDYKDLVPHLIASVYYQQSNYEQVINYVPTKLEQQGVVAKSEMLQMLGDSYYQLKNYPKAAEYFTLLSKEGGSLSRELKYRIGFCQFKNAQYSESIKTLKDVAGQDDTLGQSGAFYMGLSYLQLKEKNFALSSFDIAKRSDFNPKTKEEAHFLYAKLLADLGDFHRSLESIKSFKATFPGSVREDELSDLQSICYGRTSKYDESITWYESQKRRSLIMNRDYQRHTFFKATENYNNEKYDEALNLFNKSLTVPQDNELVIAANYWKGEIYSIKKEFPKAIEQYESAISKAPNENAYKIKSHFGIGYGYFNTKEYDKALQEFNLFTKKADPTKLSTSYNDALLRIGDLYFEKRKYSEALLNYDKAIQNKARDIDYAYYQKGVILIRENKLDEAKSCFKRILENYPESLLKEGSIFSVAEIDFVQSNLDNAVAGFSQLIGNKLNNQPFEPEALLKRAVIYGQQNKNDEAIADYLTILDKYYSLPIHEDALRGVQELYTRLERTEEFEKKLAEFKTKNPTSNVLQDVDFESARNLFFAEKYAKSLSSFSNYLSKYPESSNSAEARYYLAECYYQTNDKDKAKAEFEKVLQERTSSNIGKSIQRLAEINQTKNNLAEANKYYKLLLDNAKNKREKNISYTGLASNFYTLQQYDSCELYASELLKFNPPNTSHSNKAHMMIARCAYSKNNFEKAEDHWLEITNNNKEELAAEAQYMIAESLYKQKKYKPSTETCYQLNNQYSQYEFWLGKSYLLIAENLVAQKELVHAKATIKSVLENTTDTRIKELANTRLTELNAMKTNE